MLTSHQSVKKQTSNADGISCSFKSISKLRKIMSHLMVNCFQNCVLISSMEKQQASLIEKVNKSNHQQKGPVQRQRGYCVTVSMYFQVNQITTPGNYFR